VVRQGYLIRTRVLIAVVGTFLIVCAGGLVVGCAGARAEASQEEEQEHAEATKQEQGNAPGAAPEEEDRCEGTRYISFLGARYATNDVPGCPKGGLLSGTDSANYLAGGEGDDEIRGLGSPDRQFDELWGGDGSDVLYGGAEADFLYGQQDDDVLYGGDGGDILLVGGKGADVIYGGDGNDSFEESGDGRQDKLYCGKGRDQYSAEKIDYVDSSCEEGRLVDTGGPPLILLAGAALLLTSSGLMMRRYVIRRAT
jgi:Ca2+-binding RTX toxin-like protein